MTSKRPGALCDECPLQECRGLTGRFAKGSSAEKPVDVVIVGESPGRQEMIQQAVFVGPSGKLLSRVAGPKELGNIYLTNAALCYTEDTKDKERAAKACAPRLWRELLSLSPRLVVSMGNIPTESLLGPGPGITKRRGHAEERNGLVILPTVHPAYVLRSGGALPDFEQDFAKAESFLAQGRATFRVPEEDMDISYTVTSAYRDVLQRAASAPFAVLDLETSSLDICTTTVLCMVVAPQGDPQVYILPQSVMGDLGFRDALRNCPARWSGHNAKFDRNVLAKRWGINLRFAHDSLLGHYTLDERKGTHGLKEIARALWNAPDWEAPLQAALKERKSKSYADVPPALLHKYAALDGHYQRRLTEHIIAEHEKLPKRRGVYTDLLIPAMHALSNAEVKGVLLDLPLLHTYRQTYAQKTLQVLAHIHKIIDRPFDPTKPKDTFNAASPPQVAAVMFDELGLPQLNGRSTDATTVLKRYEKPHPFVSAILEFRELNTMVTRYLNGLEKAVSPFGTVHTNFNLQGTTTGRLSSSDPNLQNQPRKNADIKKLFTPDPGNWWIETDYSQIELRVIALLSQDPWLLQCYREGRDLHGEMGEEVYGPNYTKEQRSLAKGMNFGLAYGRTIFGIMQDGDLNIPLEEAERIKEVFFARMPGVVRWIAETKASVLKDHYIETPLGRVRNFPEIVIARSAGDRERIFREAVNNNPQSVASDVTLRSFTILDALGYDMRITVHDSVVAQAPRGDVVEVARETCRVMEESARELLGDDLPFPAEAGVGPTWGDIKEIEL